MGELRRQAATDLHSGAAVELLSPQGAVLLRPDARGRFERAQQVTPAHVGRLAVLAVGVEGGRPVAVRAPIGRPWGPDLRVEPAEALAILSTLGARIIEAGEATGGILEPVDLALDAEGRPVFAPSGLHRGDEGLRPSRYSAPESSGGPAARALYGLGVVVFEAVTGLAPVEGGAVEALRRAQASPRSLKAARPDAPDALDTTLRALLGLDGAARLTAIAALSPAIPSPLRSPQPLHLAVASAASPPRPPRVSVPSPPSAQLDVALPELALVARVSLQPQSLRRRLAALAGLDRDLLEEAARRGLPVFLGGGRDAAELDRLRLDLDRAGVPLEIVSRPGGALLPALALALTVGFAGTLLLSLTLGLLAALALGGLLGGLAGAALLTQRLLSAGRVDAELRDAIRLRPPAEAVDPALQGLRGALQALRRRALLRGLPDPIRLDLLGAADEIDARLDEGEPPTSALAEAVAALEATLEPAASGLRDGGAPSAELSEDLHRRAALIRGALRSP